MNPTTAQNSALRIPHSALLLLLLALTSTLSAQPRGTNTFWRREAGLRIFSVDWFGLTPGHTYDFQSSMDGTTWRRRSTITWTSSDPTAYWRTQFPIAPPTPVGLTVFERFRLVDVTPAPAPSSTLSQTLSETLPTTSSTTSPRTSSPESEISNPRSQIPPPKPLTTNH